MMLKKGCEVSGIRNYQIENIRFNRCPGNYTNTQVRYLIDWFLMYEKGVMPFGGTLSDQPGKLIEIFELIQSIRDEKEIQREREVEKEAARKNSKSR
jgi:hypothetical protein